MPLIRQPPRSARVDTNPDHSEEYRAYLASPAWAALAERRKREAQGVCQVCGLVGELHLHHLTYARLGDEHWEDLMVLCRDCHELADQVRIEELDDPDARRTRNAVIKSRLRRHPGHTWSMERYDWVIERVKELREETGDAR